MPKNPNRKDGRFCVRVYVGIKDGKKQYKAVYGTSQRAAETKARKIRASLEKGINLSSENDTFKEWADSWLKIKEMEVSDSWYVGCKGYVDGLSSFYDRKIISIRTADIQDFILELARNNPKTHRPTAKRTLKGYKDTISQIMQLAIDNRVMDYNPAGPVKLPGTAPKESRRALTEEEQKWIIETPHRAKRVAMIMMYSGLRRGELIPLTWQDIDFDNHAIRVNKSVEMFGSKPKIKPYTKTAAGMRIVNIPNVLVNYLKEERQKNINCLLVCPSDSGEMLTDTAWRRMWASYLVDLNFRYGNHMDKKGSVAKSKFNPNGIIRTIPNITAHWLRHTFATMLYLSGVDVLTAKDQLGHSDIKTTLEIYTHLDQTYKKKNISKLDEYLKNKTG